MDAPIYVHLRPGGPLPFLHGATHFKAVVVAETESTPEWQAQVSGWLVRGGCRYAMTWGHQCDDWETSVDEVNLAMFDYGEIPEDDFVMTTCHRKESLKDAFWFSDRCAMHPSLELHRTYIVHIAPTEKQAELLKTFRDAQEENN